MKRIIFVLLLIIFLFFPQIQFAQANKELKMVAIPQESSEKSVDYQLPYPGLLPDSRLYFLKVLRDRLVSLFVSDPLKKAELNLLNADKRLNGAFYLFNKDKTKIKLIQSTVSKAENYLGLAIAETVDAKKQGMDTADIIRRLAASSKKHQEIVRYLEKQSPLLKEEFILLGKRIIDFEKQVDALKPL